MFDYHDFHIYFLFHENFHEIQSEEDRQMISEELLKAIHDGLSDEDYHNVINAGIRKINFYTYSARYAGKKAYELMQNNPDGLLYQEIVITAREAVKEETERAIKLFNNK